MKIVPAVITPSTSNKTILICLTKLKSILYEPCFYLSPPKSIQDK
jgi:hypothetical protein